MFIKRFWAEKPEANSTFKNSRKAEPNSQFQDCSKFTRSKLSPLYEDGQQQESKRRSLDDFQLLRVIGKGCMGKVLLSREKSSGKIYAVKSISKKWVLSHGKQEVEHIMAEQKILASLSQIKHPFLIRLHCSFQNVDNLFLILEYVSGGDLATQLEISGHFDISRSRFYCAEIVSGILELHRLGIIYRDLKPENVLLCTDGHIKLTDFGLSKQFKISTKLTHDNELCLGSHDCACLKTKTFCGTAEYLAPEILLEKPYSFEVDWWSLGTFLYEMIIGITPFWAENHLAMYKRVLDDALEFPPDISDPIVRDFISKLLVRDPTQRLGHDDVQGLSIKNHPFFNGLSWQQLYAKKISAPYIPKIKSELDVSWFDKMFTTMSPKISPSILTQSPSTTVSKSIEEQDENSKNAFMGYTYLSNSAQKMMHGFHLMTIDGRPSKKKKLGPSSPISQPFNNSFHMNEGTSNGISGGGSLMNGNDLVLSPLDPSILEDESLAFEFEDL